MTERIAAEMVAGDDAELVVTPVGEGSLSEALAHMDHAKELLIKERELGGRNGRSISVAITELETAMLWADEAMAGPGESALGR
jgi:hypothetical protein